MPTIVKKFHRCDGRETFNSDHNSKIARDEAARQFKSEGYTITKSSEKQEVYPPSTYPPKRYCNISKVSVKVYIVTAKRHGNKRNK